MFKSRSTENSINLDSSNYWSSIKKLNQMIARVIVTQSSDAFYDLQSLLKFHKPNFLNLLKNEPKNASRRELVQKASTDGIPIVQEDSRSNTIIPDIIVKEALTLSDMFELNELLALELIITGTEQEARYPGMSRGPIAVLLYYDAKRSILASLKLLIDSLNGRTWSTKLNTEVHKFIAKFTMSLKEQGIVMQCLQQLEAFGVTEQFDLLLLNLGLGPAHYKKQVFDIIKEIQQLYAGIIFSFAAQSDINPKEASKLIHILSKKCELDSNGCLDYVSATLLMALLYEMDVSLLQTCDENDPRMKVLPVNVHKNLVDQIRNSFSNLEFNIDSVHVIINFAWIITAKTLSLFPIEGVNQIDGEEDKLIDEVIDKKLFEAMITLLAQNPHIYKEEFYLRKLHELLSDFIFLFPLKVKELRDKGDESGRIIDAYMAENIQPPPTLFRHFEKFLHLMAEVYLHDTFGFSSEVWNANVEESRASPKNVTFHKFIRSTVDSYLPQVLHVPVLKLLASFANLSPFHVYSLLKCTGISHNSQFSFDNFFTTLHNYYSSLRQGEKIRSPLHSSMNQTRQVPNFANVYLSPLELEILCSILQLIENVVRNDRNCCLLLVENQRYSCIPTLIGLLISPVPRKLKASTLSAISGFAQTTASISLGIWIKMDGILPKPAVAATTLASTQQQIQWSSGMAVEIEDIEPRLEEYQITLSFLRAIKSIVTHISCNRQPIHQSSLESCLAFVINSILLKCGQRNYKLEEEKWLIKFHCLALINTILEIFDPLKDGPSLKGAFSIISQILQENTLFTCLMEIIEDIVSIFEPGSSNISAPIHKNTDLLEECLLEDLKLLNLVSSKEEDFIQSVRSLPGYPSAMVMNLATLFSNVNHKTENIDRLATLIKAISLSTTLVQIESLILLQNLVNSDNHMSEKILLQIKPFVKYHEDYFIHGFVDCLESEEEDLSIETLKFISCCVKKDNIPGSYGFSHRLLGFDRNKGNLRTSGSLGQSYNCFHAMLNILNNEDESSKKKALSMEIIYTLCQDSDCTETVLRFLRTSYEFISKYLEKLERKRLTKNESWVNKSNILEVAWFLRILSIELKIITDNNLKTSRNAYMKALLGENGEKKFTDMVPKMIFKHVHPEMSKWEFFDSSELWKTISEATSIENVIDIKMLHQKLISEVNLFGSQLGLVQTNMIQNEIYSILQFATALNTSQEQLNANILFFQGWRELVETIVSVKCLEIFDENIRIRLLLELIQEMLQRASSVDTVTSLITPISSLILLASSYLCSNKPEVSMKTHLLTTAKGIMSLLESSSSSFLWNQYKRARVNLYAALLHLYRILPQSLLFELKLSARLLEKLCKDILSGHEITKVLAMSLLNESETIWAYDLSHDGTLRLIIDSLVTDDKEIKANKFDVHCKGFYSFDSKMALLMRICTTDTGVRIVCDSGIMEVLASLECFELYPFLFGESDVCTKMFNSIIRLLLTMSNSCDQQYNELFAHFIDSRSAVLSDILRMASTIKNSSEGITVLALVTALVSKFISSVTKQLQRPFLCLLNNYLGSIEAKESRIVANILSGYVRINSKNSKVPMLAPSWNSRGSFVNVGTPTLGSLILLIEENTEKCNQEKSYLCIIESCIYLLWSHLNFYFNQNLVGMDQRHEIQKLKSEAPGVTSDLFFSKIQNFSSDNSFIMSMIRRIKRMIKLE